MEGMESDMANEKTDENTLPDWLAALQQQEQLPAPRIMVQRGGGPWRDITDDGPEQPAAEQPKPKGDA